MLNGYTLIFVHLKKYVYRSLKKKKIFSNGIGKNILRTFLLRLKKIILLSKFYLINL